MQNFIARRKINTRSQKRAIMFSKNISFRAFQKLVKKIKEQYYSHFSTLLLKGYFTNRLGYRKIFSKDPLHKKTILLTKPFQAKCLTRTKQTPIVYYINYGKISRYHKIIVKKCGCLYTMAWKKSFSLTGINNK